MNFRVGILAAIVILLGGCTGADWDRLTTFNSVEHPDTVAQTDAPAAETASISPVQPGNTLSPDAVEGAQRQDVPPAQLPVQSASVAATPVSVTERYCRRVGRDAAGTSQRDGSDISTQQQASDATYQQCLAFYGSR